MAETIEIMPKSPELEFEPEQIIERSQQIFGLMNAGIDSMDASVVQTMVGSLVKLGEVADELNRPELLERFLNIQGNHRRAGTACRYFLHVGQN